MGMDCYLRWNDQGKEEKDAQITGFDITKGDVGYLRESIGGVHAATWLFPEAFADEEGSLEGPRKWYGSGGEFEMNNTIMKALGAVADAAGPVVTIEGPDFDKVASGFPPDGYCVEAIAVEKEESHTWGGETSTWTEISWRIPSEVLQRRLPIVETLVRKRYEGDPYIEEAIKSYYGFVALHAQLEAAGREPSIYVSY